MGNFGGAICLFETLIGTNEKYFEYLEKEEYTPEQKALLEEIEVHNYEIDKNYNREEQRQRSIKYRAEAIAKLKAMGINVEVD